MARHTQIIGGGASTARGGGMAGNRSQSQSHRADTILDLSRLLARLQQSIMLADAERERRLRTSEFERYKAGSNLDYARNLLTRLEKEAMGIKIQARRQETQAELNALREAHEQLQERLRELEELSIDSDDDEGDGAEEEDGNENGEDWLKGLVVATPSESTESASHQGGGQATSASRGNNQQKEISANDNDDDMGGWGEEEEPEEEEEERVGGNTNTTAATATTAMPTEIEPTAAAAAAAAATPTGTATTQTLRPRGGAGPASNSTTTSTAAAATTSSDSNRTQLFDQTANSQQPQSKPSHSQSATTEAILDQHRAEQDQLTSSLVTMAARLKLSSQQFGEKLDQEKDLLEGAKKSLNRNETSIESASRIMSGSLRGMSEGQGWWGRMRLYACLAGMALLAVLLVFVGPKLRF